MSELSIHNFSVSGVGNLCLMILEEANKSVLPEAKSHETSLKLNACYSTFQKSIDRTIRKNKNSPAATAAEKRRSKALTGARSIVKGLMNSPDATMRAKAQRVYAELDKFGAGVERLHDDDETTKLLSILEGLDDPAVKPMVAELNLTAFVEELRTATNEYLKEWNIREDDVEEYRNTASATNQLGEVQEAIDSYYDYVVAMSKYDTKKEEWAKLASAIHSRYVTLKQNQQQGKSSTKPDTK